MHLFLQICGVVGFSIFGLLLPEYLSVRAGNTFRIPHDQNFISALGFALISTYFIFG